MDGRTDGRTEGRNAENYVPPLFFEKAGDKNFMSHNMTLLYPNLCYIIMRCVIKGLHCMSKSTHCLKLPP